MKQKTYRFYYTYQDEDKRQYLILITATDFDSALKRLCEIKPNVDIVLVEED